MDPSRLENPRPASLAFRSVSMESDWSMDHPKDFRTEESSLPDGPRPTSPAFSSVSMTSDESMGTPLLFRTEESRPASPASSDVAVSSDWTNEQTESFGNDKLSLPEGPRPTSPAFSSVSMKSDHSRRTPLLFRTEESRPASPASSDITVRSDWTNEQTENFGNEKPNLLENPRPASPAFSSVSMESDWSKDMPLFFRTEKTRPVCPASSDVTVTSDWSKEDRENFGNEDPNLLENPRPASLAFSSVSMESDWSMDHPKDFRTEGPRPVSSASTDVTMRSDRSKDETEKFGKEEPSPFQESTPVTPQLISGPTTGDPSEDQRFPPIKVKLDENNAKHQLTEDEKNRVLAKYENELSQVEIYSELFQIVKNKKDEDKHVQTYKDLFMKSKKQKARTVLTKGLANVGKTLHTKMFRLDWAKGNSNKNIDLIVPLHFSELNARRHKVQSMEDLLYDFVTDVKQREIYNYKGTLAFVLDGLEMCELPLDFKNNQKVTNMKEEATMDVLLTNLIKGKLLPNAHIWIISQPSGVVKIPPKYIQKVTECREIWSRQLASNLRKRFLIENTQVEDITHPNHTNTEHIMREKSSGQLTEDEENGQTFGKSVKVKELSDIFKEKHIRTVLTVGEAGIGKSFHVQKFVKAWAKNDKKHFLSVSKDEIKVVFPLNIWELNLMNKTKISLVGLLHHLFEETKKSVITDYAQINVVLVLDGLDRYPHLLDFDNTETLTDVREPASVDVLLTNLIRGKLLPSAKVWITSRPSEAKQLPDDCIGRMTEIREKPDVTSQRKVRSQLKEQFNSVVEGINEQKTSALLNEIYTDLYIIEGERGEVNQQHESRQVQQAKFKPVREETPIKYCDIFKPPSDQHHIKTVLTMGVAGIGKTFAIMKYMLDWGEDKALKHIHFIFPLPFRELNLRRGEEHSLEELLHQFFPSMKNSEITNYDKYQILIVLDGFDECHLDLEFSERSILKDVRQKTSVNDLLTNLIMGNLLPKAQIWITSRPGASNNIPAESVDRVTEVRGFNDEQKEEYFRKRFSDQSLAEIILSHVKTSRSLYIMCHIPVFCWITSQVLEDFVSRNQKEGMPKTMTDMYVHFVLQQCRQANVKYGNGETDEGSETDSCWNQRNKETILSLGQLAFEQLEEGNLFTEGNLTDCGVDITKAAVFSGVFTQIKREGHGFYEQKLFCFVHLSIQEFLAAFYVHHTFNTTGENLLNTPTSVVSDLPESDFYKNAVDKALDNDKGDWDLFLRFLLGLSLETNQRLLKDLLKKTENDKETYKETVEYIKEKINKGSGDADKNLNLFHCLNELNDDSLVVEVKKYLQSETQAFESFSASQWSALTYVLLTSDENLEEFDLKKYRKSVDVLLGMLPVVKVSKTSLLSWCNLSEESCNGLTSSVLCSASSNLTKLDLSHNDLKNSGVERLADGLKSLNCKLEILKLSGCQVTEEGCSFLASALRSNTASHLKQLDLSYNHPGDNVEMMFSDAAPHLKLCVDHCGEHRLKPGLKKYGAHLRLNENTAGKRLILTKGNRKVETRKKVTVKAARPHSDDTFKRSQVFCGEGQKGFCYWEVEWEGTVGIAVAYERVGRNWDSSGGLGCNEMSWSLLCSDSVHGRRYTARHAKTSTPIKRPRCQKIAVFLDWEGGTLSYYSVSSGKLSLIHTFHAKFTDPLFPAFWFENGSVTLCHIE